MTNFTPTHVHKVTGKQYQEIELVHWQGLPCIVAWDENGEKQTVRSSMLTPIQPVEEWEPVRSYENHTGDDGVLHVLLADRITWVTLPYPEQVRLVDGCRLERRKE